jgi:heptosyltransferase I
VPQVDPFADLRALRPKRVCVIKPSALGDIVNALPVLSALRAHWPRAHIAWVVSCGLRGLLDGNPELDQVIPFDRKGPWLGAAGAMHAWRFFGGLWRLRFDVAIDLQGLFRSGLMAASTGAPIRVGRAETREGAQRFYTHRVPPPSPRAHAVDRLLSIARAFGAEVDSPRFVLPITDDARRWARNALRAVPAPRVVINLGAKWPTKRWPPSHYAEIARRCVAAFGAGLIAVGATEDRPLVESFREHVGGVRFLDLCEQTTLPQLAALMAEADLVVSNDTGPLHLAAAAGARVVGVYTCTDPDMNGPYGLKSLAVRTGIWCGASYLSRCERLECMVELTPERVWPVVKQQLALVRAQLSTHRELLTRGTG